MKTIAYTALHYGTDYLGFAIKSVIDYVDEYWVLYAAQGSHGHRTTIPCPDSRDDLHTIARAVAGTKLHWVDGEWAHEGLQRGSITEHCPDAELILVLDADEIWNDEVFHWLPQGTAHRTYRVPIIHYWRSFYRCILHDPAFPVRIIYPQLPAGEGMWHGGFINHMGYAQRPEIVQYKQITHGHKNEWRTDCDWFRDKFMANAQEDCHPVGSDYWYPEQVDPEVYMPDFMKQHPYWGLDVIA